MKDLPRLLLHLLTTAAKLLGPGGAKAVVADSLLMNQQLLVITPNLSALDRFLFGFWSKYSIAIFRRLRDDNNSACHRVVDDT